MIMRQKRSITWLVVLLWMGVIFYLSHQPANESSELSGGIVDYVVQLLEKTIPLINFNLDLLHHLIRKGAHFTAYLILGLLVIFAIRRHHTNVLKSIFLTLIICVLYAISDEIHQLFIPGRSGEVRDVIIDSAGATTGILCYMIVHKRGKRT